MQRLAAVLSESPKVHATAVPALPAQVLKAAFDSFKEREGERALSSDEALSALHAALSEPMPTPPKLEERLHPIVQEAAAAFGGVGVSLTRTRRLFLFCTEAKQKSQKNKRT